MICLAIMVKLRRLSITKYRAVKPGTVLYFNDGYNVLLGINGAGKTTLLKLVAMCLSCSFAGLEEQEFSVQYDLAVPEGLLEIDVRHLRSEPFDPQQPTLESTIAVRFSSQSSSCRPFRLNLAQGVLSLDGEDLTYSPKRVVLFGPGSFVGQMFKRSARALLQTEADALRGKLSQFRATFEQVEASMQCLQPYSRFDEGTEWLKEVLEEASLDLTVSDGQHIGTHELKRMAGNLEKAIVRRVVESENAGAGWHQAEVISLRQDELPFLAQAIAAFGYKDATVRLALRSAEPAKFSENGDAYKLTFGRPQFSFIKRDGTFLELGSLSFGQKRLVAFFYYLAIYPSVLIADELANGMHHAMIERCLEAAGQRQMFLATQNPLLLDHVPFANAEEVRATFIRCEVATTGKREQMIWSALTEEESSEFFKDYEVGIQHTNDILRLRGLW